MKGVQKKTICIPIFLLILSLIIVSCKSSSGGEGKGTATTEPVVATATEQAPSQGASEAEQVTVLPPTEQPTAEVVPVPTTEPTELPEPEAAVPVEPSQEPPESPTEQPGSQGGAEPAIVSGAGMGSYRIHTIWREESLEGAVTSEWQTEYVADPLAVHHTSDGQMKMEMIFIGTTLWSKIMDQAWRQTDLAEEATADWESMLTQTESPVDIEEQAPLEDDIQWLMGQPGFKIVEGSLTPAGEEIVNDVQCRRYVVDSTYAYSVTLQSPLSGSAEITMLTQGDIWVADQGEWPPFVVRVLLLETSTTQVVGGESSIEIEYIEQNVTDVNSSDIVIEAPQ